MIRDDQLRAQMPSEPDLVRLRRIAGVVAGAVGSSLDLATGIAVIEVLAGRRFTTADGVVWNGAFSGPDEEVWTGEAAIIVSALSELPHDGVWWRRQAALYEKDEAYQAVVDRVVAALSASPSIKEIES
jgi:hypothetical protein